MRWVLASVVAIATGLVILGGLTGRIRLQACCANLRAPKSVDRLPGT